MIRVTCKRTNTPHALSRMRRLSARPSAIFCVPAKWELVHVRRENLIGPTHPPPTYRYHAVSYPSTTPMHYANMAGTCGLSGCFVSRAVGRFAKVERLKALCRAKRGKIILVLVSQPSKFSRFSFQPSETCYPSISLH